MVTVMLVLRVAMSLSSPSAVNASTFSPRGYSHRPPTTTESIPLFSPPTNYDCTPESLAVDGHRVRRAMAAAYRPVFSWQIPTVAGAKYSGRSNAACGRQAAYQVQVTDGSSNVVFDSERVASSVSDGVRLPPLGTPALAPMQQLQFRVRVWAGDRDSADYIASAWSHPCQFVTRISSATMNGVLPLWSAPPPAPREPTATTDSPPARFALLRGTFDCTWPTGRNSTFLMISAKPSPNWKADAPRGNASKLLGAYKAWLNGVPLGIGPGRTYAQGVGVDVYNVSVLLHCGGDGSNDHNVLAVQGFYQPLGFPGTANGTDDAPGLWIALYDTGSVNGGKVRFSSGPAYLSAWSAFEAADEAFGITGALGCVDKMCTGDVAQRYFQPAENIDMRIYPDGWQQPQGQLSLPGFRPAVQRSAGAFTDGLSIKDPMPLTLRQQQPLRFLNVTRSDSGDIGTSWSYIVDFGCNFQGGLNVSFTALAESAGRVVRVRTGETLCPNGSVAYYISRTRGPKEKGLGEDHICLRGLPHEDVLNNWTSNWVLRGENRSAGTVAKRQHVETHEYVVLRYAEIVGAPEPPTPDSVRGWAVQYPFDGLTSERDGLPILAECTAHRARETSLSTSLSSALSASVQAQRSSVAALTTFQSSVPALDAVWRLCHYTVVVGALDSNTDSNTRQRDICNLDAMLASRYQGAVAGLAAEHPRRQIAATLSTPQVFTNNHTLEFNVAAVAALYFFALEYSDYTPSSVAAQRFDEILRRFGMLELVDTEGTGLVCGAPNALVDHPPSKYIDVDDDVRARCSEASTSAGAPCTVTNALAVQVQRQLAVLAERLGRPLLAQSLNTSADGITANLQRELIRRGSATKCSPPAPACFGDAVSAPDNATSLHATMVPAAIEGLLPAEILPQLLPFIQARSARRGLNTHGLECSGWGALTLAEALFRIARAAEATSEGAATYATRTLISNGTNSWVGGMLDDADATMTMEAWALDEGSGTYSHPWTASPSIIVPRLLMGLAPIEGEAGDAWRVVAIRPFPTAILQEAALSYPSPRGVFVVRFRASLDRWDESRVFSPRAPTSATVMLNVTVPGNTGARVCLPKYLAQGYGSGRCSTTLDETPAQVSLQPEGAMLCWPHELSGVHRIAVRCA